MVCLDMQMIRFLNDLSLQQIEKVKYIISFFESFSMNLNCESKLLERSNFDETKETFMDKLKNYQTLGSFNKTTKLNPFHRLNSMLNETGKSTFTQQLNHTSPRFGQSLTKRLLTPPQPKNSIEQFKQKLYGKLQTCPETSYSLIRTKLTTQQNYFQEQFQKNVHEVSLIDGKFESFQDQQTQKTKDNFMRLDSVEKYLIGCQKAHNQDYTLVSQKSKQIVHQTIKKATEIITRSHKSHLESSLKALTTIDQQTQFLKDSLQTQSQLSQQDWCSGLDRINDQILALNTLITETKLEENNRFTDLQWRVKEMQFSCEEQLERENKERLEKESRLYSVLERLIERVGTVAV